MYPTKMALPPSHAGAALDAVIAALPRDAKRQLRAASRACRAAVDSRVTAIELPFRVSAAGLPAAVARMPRLRSLYCVIAAEADCAELAGALGAAPASLASFRYMEGFSPASDDGPGPQRALAEAIASRSGLADLDLQLGPSPGQGAAFVAAAGRLPRLRTLRVSAGIQEDANPWREAPPALAPPTTLQASALGS
jgi:hypothetical protein